MKKTAIITAMREEAEHIINNYSLTQTKIISNIEFYENSEIVLVLVWIGKIQAAIWTTMLFENYKFEKLVNIWIVWNLAWSKQMIWDVFLVNKISQHDMYLPFDWAHLDYAKKPIIIENTLEINKNFWNFKVINNAYCLTWDQFIDDENKVLELYNTYNANICEMEAFAVASVARVYNFTNLVFIKAISDWADNTSKDDHMNNLDFAMKNSIIVLEEVLK